MVIVWLEHQTKPSLGLWWCDQSLFWWGLADHMDWTSQVIYIWQDPLNNSNMIFASAVAIELGLTWSPSPACAYQHACMHAFINEWKTLMKYMCTRSMFLHWKWSWAMEYTLSWIDRSIVREHANWWLVIWVVAPLWAHPLAGREVELLQFGPDEWLVAMGRVWNSTVSQTMET